MYKIVISLACFLLCIQFLPAQSTQQLSSPDGKLQFRFLLSDAGIPEYSVTYQQKPVVLPSVLGLSGWENKFSLSDVVATKKDTAWKPVYGERSLVKDSYN